MGKLLKKKDIQERFLVSETPYKLHDPQQLHTSGQANIDDNQNTTSKTVAPSAYEVNDHHVHIQKENIQTLKERMLKDVEEKKATMQAELEKEKAQVLSAAKEEAEKLKQSKSEEGFQKGLEEGKAQGIKEGKQQFEKHSSELVASINENLVERKKIVSKSEHFIVSLSKEMARKITGIEVVQNDNVFKAILDEAFLKVTDKEHLIIEVNPEDLPFVETYQKQFKAKFKDVGKLEIKVNQTLERGSCTIETKLGYVDASVSTKLNLIEAALISAVEDTDKELPSFESELETENINEIVAQDQGADKNDNELGVEEAQSEEEAEFDGEGEFVAEDEQNNDKVAAFDDEDEFVENEGAEFDDVGDIAEGEQSNDEEAAFDDEDEFVENEGAEFDDVEDIAEDEQNNDEEVAFDDEDEFVESEDAEFDDVEDIEDEEFEDDDEELDDDELDFDEMSDEDMLELDDTLDSDI